MPEINEARTSGSLNDSSDESDEEEKSSVAIRFVPQDNGICTNCFFF